MSNELAQRPEATLQTSQGLLPALSFNQMALRYNAMQQMAKEIMRQGADYGVIPGTGDKPTLLKPGAEKLCALFGLRPVFVIVREVEDWEKGIFYYWYKCQLYSGDRLVGEGEGSANSKEKKYRWRTVYDNKATDEEKRLGKLEVRKGRNNSSYKVYVIENTEPFDLINTLQKMAQKRALVAVTLIVTSASDFFTQDVEDMVDVEFREVPGESQPTQSPSARASSTGNGITNAQVNAIAASFERGKFTDTSEGKAETKAFVAWVLELSEPVGVKALTNAQAEQLLNTIDTRTSFDAAFQEYTEWQSGKEVDAQPEAEAA